MNIFTRQIAFLGPSVQNILKNTPVAIIGLGALGSTTAHLLVRMGFENLTLCDDDVVADHNLSRQHLYTIKDIGLLKVIAARDHLLEINPNCNITILPVRITTDNISVVFATIFLDGTDNHASRRIIDKHCKLHNLPWIHGASIEDKGTVIFFSKDINYGDVYQNKVHDQHCSVSGVLVTATTLTATLQVSLLIDFIMQKPLSRIMYRISGSHIEQIPF